MNKKFKKITACLILAIYLFLACFPVGILAETKIDKLDYYYTRNKELFEEYSKTGLSIVYNGIADYAFRKYVQFDYEKNPNVYKEALKKKYPDKASSFNEYNPEYATDYIDVLLTNGFEKNSKLLIGQTETIDIGEDEPLKIFMSGPISYMVFSEIDDDEEDELYDNFDDYKAEIEKNYFNEFFNEYIKCDGLTLDDLEEIYDKDDLVSMYLLSIKYDHGKLLTKYTKEEVFKYMFESATESYLDYGDYDAFGQFDVRAALTGETGEFGLSYNNQGYNTHLDIDGKEVTLGAFYPYTYEAADALLYTIVDANGIHYNKPNFVKLDISLKNTDNTTVVATYTLKNTQNKTINFKLGTASDLEMGSNDNAAITKISNGFRITQDSMGSFGYPAQVNITNSPASNTLYVGPYHTGDGTERGVLYFDHVFENSSRTYYTKADSTDTALAYSWNGTLAAGETKTFTTTFTISIANDVDVTYHKMDKTTSVETVLGGGAFQTIEGSMAPEKGYHSEWNTKSDGTGTFYEFGTWMIASNEDMHLYEVKVKNTVEGTETSDVGHYLDGKILNPEVLNEMLKEEADNSYNDVKIVLDINDSRNEIEDETKEIIDKALTKDFAILNYFDADIYKLVYNSPETYDKGKLTELNKKLKISLTLPRAYINTDSTIERTYELIRIHDDKAEVIDCKFDATTGELIFESDKFSTFALSYKDTVKPVEPKENVPDTFDKVIYSFGGIALAIGTIGAVYFASKKKNIRN